MAVLLKEWDSHTFRAAVYSGSTRNSICKNVSLSADSDTPTKSNFRHFFLIIQQVKIKSFVNFQPLPLSKLTVIQCGIRTFIFKKFPVSSLFGYISVFHKQNHIGITNRRQTMRNNKTRSAIHQFLHSTA